MSMLKHSLVITTILLVGSCQTVHSQKNEKLDSIFSQNFKVLKAVSKGLRTEQSLTTRETVFLYLIAGWTGNKIPYDHNKGFTFEKSDVDHWQKWYSKHARQIDIKDYDRYTQIMISLTQGVVPDEDLEELRSIDKKYSSLK